MKASGRKKRITAIIVAAASALIASGFAATAFVYGAVFARFDKEAELPADAFKEEYLFPSGENELAGYLLGDGSDLVVIVPGFRAVKEDYYPVAQALAGRGFAVFAFDPTGVGESGGADQRGFPQEITDLASCLDFIEANGNFGCSRVLLLGHSRGGTAACVLADRADKAAVVGALASVADGVLQPPYKLVGGFAYLNLPNLMLVQTLRFGPALANASAIDAVRSTDTEILVVQGKRDDTALPGRFSLYSRLDGSEPNVTAVLVDYGHVDALCIGGHANDEVVEMIADFFGAQSSRLKAQS